MYLSRFSDNLDALNMTATEECTSLCQSADDLGIPYPPSIRYESRNTVFRHQRFHYLNWGEKNKSPVLLLHGGNQSAHSWDLVSLNLSGRHQVFALDQRGHGDSEWSRGAHYGIDEMALDAGVFIDNENLVKPVVIGHSMGGLVTLAMSLNDPSKIGACVIVDIGPEVGAAGKEMIRNFVGKNIEFDDMETFLDRVEKYDPYRSRQHIERTLKYNLIRRADGKFVSKADRRRYHDGAARLPELEQLEALDMPVLIVRGANSNVLEREAAERFVDRLPQGELVEVPDCGHNVASQNTPGFLAVLNKFLEQHEKSV